MKRAILSTVLLGALSLTGSATAELKDSANFHHAHLNVVDVGKSIDFYEKIFGTPHVKFRGVSDAVLTDRSFFLFNEVEEAAPWEMTSGIYHLGFGGVNGPGEFEWRDKLGVRWQGGGLGTLGQEHFMYAFGPDNEVMEVWTGFRHNRFGHIHFFSDDVGAATKWYMDNLGIPGPSRIPPKPPKAPANWAEQAGGSFRYLWMTQLKTNNDVAMNIFAKPTEETINWWGDAPVGTLVRSDGRVIDHLAFSFRDIEPVLKHMKANGVEIVAPIKLNKELKIKSFFVRGPDKVLIEVVEARPIPDGVWE